ncbi:MAG: urease accessory protein UreE [Succinivibrionaceae bacterium]
MSAFNKVVDRKDVKLITDEVELDIDERRSSRLIVFSKSGKQCVIVMDRGSIIRGGTYIENREGEVLLVQAAKEAVSTITVGNSFDLVKIAYHLGNRHVPLEITSDYLRYQEDHVLDQMVEQLGGQVIHSQERFEPISGAYSHKH